jgi:hypothetical protein
MLIILLSNIRFLVISLRYRDIIARKLTKLRYQVIKSEKKSYTYHSIIAVSIRPGTAYDTGTKLRPTPLGKRR